MLFGLWSFILSILTSCSPTRSQFGVILGCLWPILGPPWTILGASWARLGPIWDLSWAILGRLGAILGPCWATCALSGRLLGPFVAISEPLSTSIGRPGRIWGHLRPLWGPFRLKLGSIWAHLGAYFGLSWGLRWDIFFDLSNHAPQMLKEGTAVHRRRRAR